MDDNHEKLDFPLYYTPLSIPSKGRKRFFQKKISLFRLSHKKISLFRRELSAFWSFFWRWLLLYIPVWLVIFMLYLELSENS